MGRFFSTKKPKHPVILVPGLGGSQLWVKPLAISTTSTYQWQQNRGILETKSYVASDAPETEKDFVKPEIQDVTASTQSDWLQDVLGVSQNVVDIPHPDSGFWETHDHERNFPGAPSESFQPPMLQRGLQSLRRRSPPVYYSPGSASPQETLMGAERKTTSAQGEQPTVSGDHEEALFQYREEPTAGFWSKAWAVAKAAMSYLTSEVPKPPDNALLLWVSLQGLFKLFNDKGEDFTIDMLSHMADKTVNDEGYDVVTEFFGDTFTLEWLDPHPGVKFLDRLNDIFVHIELEDRYFYTMAEHLVSYGFTRGKDLRGAPYDFRRAPHELDVFYDNLKTLIEDTYAENSNKPVVLVAHSMGNPVLLHFFNHKVDQAWKDKYIKAHVALAAPWKGSVKPLLGLCSGFKLMQMADRIVNRKLVRKLLRRFSSLHWLLPSPDAWGEDVLVELGGGCPQKGYRAADFHKLFQDMGMTDSHQVLQELTGRNLEGLKAPQVELHCIYGVGVKGTTAKLVYKEQLHEDCYPDVEYEREWDGGPHHDDHGGDGTVNRRSLDAHRKWKGKQKQVVEELVLPGVSHMGILKDEKVLDYIKQLVLEPKSFGDYIWPW